LTETVEQAAQRQHSMRDTLSGGRLIMVPQIHVV